MTYFMISFVLFFLFVALAIISVITVNKDIYKDVKDHATCDKQGDAASKTCGLWQKDFNLCRKGECVDCDGDCKAKKDYVPLILFISAGVMFVMFVITMILGFMNARSNKM